MEKIWYASPAQAQQSAERWAASVDRAGKVGSVHHTVPRFYLKNFSNHKGQLLVRDRETGTASVRKIDDLGITDFYTFLAQDGEYDSSMEEALTLVEGPASKVFSKLLSPFQGPSSLSGEDLATLAQFLSFQLVRGPRRRRESELLADLYVKIRAGSTLSDEDRRGLRVVPHQNEHIRLLGRLAEALYPYLLGWPVTLINLDEPLLLTCDEPVVVDVGDDWGNHLPECGRTRQQAARDERRSRKRGKEHRTVIHLYPSRPSGLERADGIVLPLTPRSILCLGSVEAEHGSIFHLTGTEAQEAAATLNEQIINNAFGWVASHPQHPSFRTMEFPPVGNLISFCDGRSVMSRELQKPPSPRRPTRIRKN
jgi:hypothetical protein